MRPVALRAVTRSHVPRVRWCAIPKLSSEEMERAIQEMNEEMHTLFGGPPGEPEPRMNSVIDQPPMAFSHVDHAPSAPSRPLESRTEPSVKEVHSARSALFSRISACTEEINSTATGDVDRATRLAACARAVAALEKL